VKERQAAAQGISGAVLQTNQILRLKPPPQKIVLVILTNTDINNL